MSGRVVHFEIPADDLSRARGFYHDCFGWQLDSLPDQHYMTVRTTAVDEQGLPVTRGAINGGLLLRQSPLIHPVLTVEVEEIETALEQVDKHGGIRLQGRQPVADIGYAAYFRDTEGNVVGLWEPAK